MAEDPRDIVDRSPMSRFQWGIVAIMTALNALDGFDALSMSFASPGISRAWHISHAELGIVMSVELIGMTLGSIILGALADNLGRQRTIVGCLVFMTLGMLWAGVSQGVPALCAARVLTGLGIGGMLAATNAAVAEATNSRNRSLAVVLMAAGFPLGSIVGGLSASYLLEHFDWRVLFLVGAGVSAMVLPITLWAAPDSVAFLIHRGGPQTLKRVNKVLTRMGQPSISELPPVVDGKRKPSLQAVFSSELRTTTILLSCAYLAHIMTFHYIFKWTPQIVADLGFAPSTAARVLVCASLGGAIGCVAFGLLTSRIELPHLTIGAMLLSAAAVAGFGICPPRLVMLATLSGLSGFTINSGVVALYSLIAHMYPTGSRASATGFIIGIGRGGAVVAPAAAGFMFTSGAGRATVSSTMAMGSLVAAAALMTLFAVRARTVQSPA